MARKRTMVTRPENKLIKVPCWTIEHSYAGGVRFRIGAMKEGEWITRRANSFRLYAPGVLKWEDFTRATFPRKSLFILFDADNVDLFARLVGDRGFACFRDDSGKLRRLMLDIVEIGDRRKDVGQWEALAKLCEIVDLFLDVEFLEDGGFVISDRAESEFARRAKEIINVNLAAQLSIAQLAEALHVSPSTLSHRFVQETGMSPIAYRSHLRIEQAKRMLKLGDPVKHVAEQLGYCDVFHFSKSFKRHAAVTPKEFAKSGG